MNIFFTHFQFTFVGLLEAWVLFSAWIMDPELGELVT